MSRKKALSRRTLKTRLALQSETVNNYRLHLGIVGEGTGPLSLYKGWVEDDRWMCLIPADANPDQVREALSNRLRSDDWGWD